MVGPTVSLDPELQRGNRHVETEHSSVHADGVLDDDIGNVGVRQRVNQHALHLRFGHAGDTVGVLEDAPETRRARVVAAMEAFEGLEKPGH